MRVIETAKHLVWFHVALRPGIEKQILDIYRLVSENPGYDQYEILVEGANQEALLTPRNNSFHYMQKTHLELERLLGKGRIESRILEVKTSYQFDSPIEQAFWDEWTRMGCNDDLPLAPQYPIGKYRVDFAHLSSKTVIELDGFASHSSTDDIANDRKRQRYIESQGWHVIRFGGKEIYHDVAGCVEEVIQILCGRGKTPIKLKEKPKPTLPIPEASIPEPKPQKSPSPKDIKAIVAHDTVVQAVQKTFTAKVVDIRDTRDHPISVPQPLSVSPKPQKNKIATRKYTKEEYKEVLDALEKFEEETMLEEIRQNDLSRLEDAQECANFSSCGQVTMLDHECTLCGLSMCVQCSYLKYACNSCINQSPCTDCKEEIALDHSCHLCNTPLCYNCYSVSHMCNNCHEHWKSQIKKESA